MELRRGTALDTAMGHHLDGVASSRSSSNLFGSKLIQQPVPQKRSATRRIMLLLAAQAGFNE